jgi:hypothetical protein
MNWITKFILVACTALAIAGNKALAHISYTAGTARDFGTVDSPSYGSIDVSGLRSSTISGQTASSLFGWADATDTDWGDSHRMRGLRFSLLGNTTISISIERASGTSSDFLPGFSVYRGLAHNGAGIALDHDFGVISKANRPSTTEGSFRALSDWSIGNDPIYNTNGDPESGIKTFASMSYFTFMGYAVDGTSANFGSTPGIIGDGTADGQITAIFNLAAGDYSIFIGGADYASQPVVSVPAYGPAPAPNPTYDNYAFNAILSVPEPSTASQLLGAVACLAVFRRRRS